MIKKITGLVLVVASSIIIWLFPALVIPRHGHPFEGQDMMQFHETEMAKERRSQATALWVCVPAGVVLGFGISLLFSGFRKSTKTEQTKDSHGSR
jgi:uncharacterized membrane-anchored protein YitT (DUF2179 family)